MSTPSAPDFPPEGTLYRDFAFAALSGGIDDSQTTIVVDDATQFPNNALLAKGPLWLTIESDLSHPPTFEIVKLTSVDSGTNTLTVERGQLATVAQAHDDAALIKGSMTAEMIRRVRGSFYGGDTPPSPDADLWSPGDRYYSRTDGQWYRFAGQALFYQYDFNGDSGYGNLADLDWLPPAQSEDLGGSSEFFSVPWRTITGTFGTGNAFNATAAIPKVLDADDVAMALVNQGSDDYWMFDVNMVIGSSSDVDAGMVFGMDATGQNGYYLQLVADSLPTLYSVLDGTPTLLGTVGPDNVVASEVVYVIVWRRPTGLIIWYQNQANSSNFWYEYAEFDVDDPFGANTGFYCKGAACLGDDSLGWTFIESFMYGTPPYNSTGFSSNDATHTPVDTPTTIDQRHTSYMVDNWKPLAGSVWGIVTNSFAGDQQLTYSSGATDDIAVVGVDLGCQDFDIAVTMTQPSDPDCDYGLWLRGTDDGQNGWYLRFGPTCELIAIVDGVEVAAALTNGTSPGLAGTAYQARIVMNRDIIRVIDPFTGEIVIGIQLPPIYQSLGGTIFGWMYRNNQAIIDTQLGLRVVTHYNRTVSSGWQSEPTQLADYDLPSIPQPVGSVWVNLYDQSVFMSTGYSGNGSGVNWAPLNVQLSSGDPSNPALYGQLYADVDNGAIWIYIGSSLSGTDWQQIGNIGDGGGGGGGGGDYTPDYPIFRGDTYGNSTQNWRFAPFGDAQVNDYGFSNGGLVESVVNANLYNAINEESNYLYLFSPPEDSGGTEDNWFLLGDATEDTSTGEVTLTTGSSGSLGGLLSSQGTAIDELHISFTMETHGDGFAVSLIPDDCGQFGTPSFGGPYTGLPPTGTPNFSLDSTPDGNGAGDDSAKPLRGFTLNFNDTTGDVTGWAYGAGASIYLGVVTTGIVTPGSHDWELLFRQVSPWSGQDYALTIYCDGVKVSGSNCYTSGNFPQGGWLLFSSLAGAGASGSNVLSNFKWIYAQIARRLRSQENPVPWIPLKLDGSWTAVGGSASPPAYRREGGKIKLRGAITGGGGSNIIADWDYGWLPERPQKLPCVQTVSGVDAIGYLSITGSGITVGYLGGSAPDVVYLDGIEYWWLM